MHCGLLLKTSCYMYIKKLKKTIIISDLRIFHVTISAICTSINNKNTVSVYR